MKVKFEERQQSIRVKQMEKSQENVDKVSDVNCRRRSRQILERRYAGPITSRITL